MSNSGESDKDVDMETYAEKVEGVINCGIVDCSVASNAKLCKSQRRKCSCSNCFSKDHAISAKAYHAVKSIHTDKGKNFTAYPYGEDKEDEAEGHTSLEEAVKEVAASVPDMVHRVGDGANYKLVEQEIQLAFQAGKFPVIVFSKKAEPNLMLKSVAAKLESGTG